MRAMLDVLASLPTVVIVLALGVLGAIGLWYARRQLNAGLPPPEVRRQQQRARVERAAQVAEGALLPTASRKRVDVERVAAVVEAFDVLALEARVREWFSEAQRARVGGASAELATHFLSGARDVAFAAGEGLERVGPVTVTGSAVQRAGGTVDGCEVHLRLDGLVEETLRGKRELIEVCEHWALGWPPAHRDWRVIHVERRWSRTLEAPRAAPAAADVAARATTSASLDADLTRAELTREALEAVAREVLASWVAAVDQGDPARLGSFASPLTTDHVAATLHRHAWFDTRLAWSVDHVEAEVARVIHDAVRPIATVRVKATSTARLLGPDGAEIDHWTGDWARYLDLARRPDGGWTWVGVCDDDAWVV